LSDAGLVTAMRAEKIRILWDYQVRLIEMHERRYLQILAAALAGGLAALASLLLERVAPITGFALAAGLFMVAAYTHFLIRGLPARLRRSMEQTVGVVERLMVKEEE